jgi:hypothetical protein
MRTVRAAILTTAALVAITASCQTDGNNLVPVLPAPGEPISFAQHIQPIFTARCAGCHRDGGLAATFSGIKLRLTSADVSYATLVNQLSAQRDAFTLVKPSDSANSLLYLKVSRHDPPVGGRMPLIGSPLSADQIRVIKDWIDQGALDN